MDFFSKKNAVLLALVQVVFIALGVLSAGCCHKWYVTCSLRPPVETVVWADFGPLTLIVPLAWVFTALRVQQRNDDTRGLMFLIYLVGIFVLLLSLFMTWEAAVRPWLRVTVGRGGL